MFRIFDGDGSSLRYKLHCIKYIPRGIKYYFQRAWRGWADCDVWGLYDYFMEVMPQMLNHLRENHMGYPAEFNTDFPSTDDEKDKIANQKWEDVLSRMEFLLKEMNEEACSQQNEIWLAYWESGMEGHMDNAAFVARQQEINDYRARCKDEFFALFNKYFYDLWD